MGNFFDQLDATPAPTESSSSPNFFDRLDAPKPQPAPAVQKLPLGETAVDVGKSSGIGLAQGALATAGGGVGDIQEMSGHAWNWLGQKLGIDGSALRGFMHQFETPESQKYAEKYGNRGDMGTFAVKYPTTSELQKTIEEGTNVVPGVNIPGTGPWYQAKTPEGSLAQGVAASLPGTVLGPAGSAKQVLGNAVRYGVIPTLAGEAAEQGAKNIGGADSAVAPWAKTLTTIAAGGITALASRPGSVESVVAKALPSFVNEGDLTQAAGLMDRGVNLSWGQALSQVTGRPASDFQNMERILSSHPETRAMMDDFWNRQTRQMVNVGQRDNAILGPASGSPSAIGPRVGEAAEGALKNVEQGINAQTESLYQAASPQTLRPGDWNAASSTPGFPGAFNSVVENPQLRREVNLGHGVDSVGVADAVKKEMTNRADNLTRPTAERQNAFEAAGWRSDADTVRDAATRSSPEYAMATHIQSELRTQVLDPLVNGPLGKLAQKDLPTKTAMSILFEKNPLANSADEIGTAVSAVAARDPGAALQLVRAKAATTFAQAMDSLHAEGGQFTGARFAKAMAGNPEQRANLQAAVEALPGGQIRWAGWNRMLEVAEATGERMPVGSRTTFNAEEAARIGSAEGVAGAIQGAATPFATIRDKIAQWKMGHDLPALASIMTDPESLPLFRRLLLQPRGSGAAVSITNQLIGPASPAVRQNAPPAE